MFSWSIPPKMKLTDWSCCHWACLLFLYVKVPTWLSWSNFSENLRVKSIQYVERRCNPGWWIYEHLCKLSQVSWVFQHNILVFGVMWCCYIKYYLSVSGGTGESKGKRKQNVVPLQINEILEAPEEGFLVEGQEVGMMVIVGKIIECEKATTKTTYRVNIILN